MWLLDVWTAGIDFALPGNGGLECYNYLSNGRKWTETVVGTALSVAALSIGLKSHNKPGASNFKTVNEKLRTKVSMVLFAVLVATYAVEIFYKLYSHQAVFIFNPCHCMCLVQLFILYQLAAGETNNSSMPLVYTFRLHLFLLHGPLAAVLFPVTNTLFLPGEVFTYWLEHILLLAIPVFLMRSTDLTVPSYGMKDNLAWGLMAFGIWGLFNFLFLQPISLVSYANLNSILCPAITDPFRGVNYRSVAIGHQFLITVAFGICVNTLGNKAERKIA